MKRVVVIILTILVVLGLNSCTKQKNKRMTKEDLKTKDQKSSYVFGVDIGNIASSKDRFEIEAFVQGVKDQLEGKGTLLNKGEMQLIRDDTRKQLAKMEKVDTSSNDSENNASEGERFLADNLEKEGVKVTSSGLQYKIIIQGKGVKPKSEDRIKVHYSGSLINGEEFDSSYKRGEPVSFKLSQVIKGWQEGLTLMPVGSKYMLYIPSKLAYGTNGKGNIPSNSVLIFEVELLDIIK
ncbi:MAG: FKBP-type peptidyl-prolyl cis-trans isomerase [Candidatus Delongbacteria bacterium]|jgi:FKBP-type peptidyl-prolyl cis-trans isomerase FkpA|nr:FKBP-type peptidyl-prolyl cis-trans isomerase [Candidatus Delongbacteria bacterium]